MTTDFQGIPTDDRPNFSGETGAGGISALVVGGVAAAFAVASCCALPILLTSAGLSAAWLGGIASIAAPYRALLLGIGLLSLAAAAILLWRKQRNAMTCGSDGVCTPPVVRLLLLCGIVAGTLLLWLGYRYA